MYVDNPQSHCRFALVHGDITPPANIYHRMWGAAKHEQATGIHRPLRATITLLAPLKGTERQFIIALDHCVMGRHEMDNLLYAVSEGSGIPNEELIVVFSHTHAAGLMGLERSHFPGGDLIKPYLDSISLKIIDLVKEAIENIQTVTILYGTGKCDLAANRDFWDEENQQWACGYNPDKRADETVLVAQAISEEGSLLASIVNYACHPTTLAWDNTLISPDFPGAMRETIEAATNESPCLFLQGASGELGPVEGFVGDPLVADKNGLQLAYASLSTMTKLPAPNKRFEYSGPVISGATLGEWKYNNLPEEQRAKNKCWQIKRKSILLPIRHGTPSIKKVEAELEDLEQSDAKDARAMIERKRRLLYRLNQLPSQENFPLEVIILRLGNAIWVIVQGELYSIFQQTLRKRFSGIPIIISTIASHWGASYLPPKEIYGTGIYQETIALVAEGSLEQVIEDVSSTIEDLIK